MTATALAPRRTPLRTRPTPLPYSRAAALPATRFTGPPPELAPGHEAAPFDRPGSTGLDPLPRVRLVPAADPTATSARLGAAVIEVLRGTRPLHQLARWVSLDVYGELEARLATPPAPLTLRARPPVDQSDAQGRVTVLHVRVCRLGGYIAEASVVVRDGDRVRAVAIRLEGRRGQWSATALECG